MSTPNKLNPFGFSRQNIMMMATIAVIIAVFVLTGNNVPPSHPIVKHTASKSALWEKAGFYIRSDDRDNGQQIVALNNRVILNNYSKVVALDGQTGKEQFGRIAEDMLMGLPYPQQPSLSETRDMSPRWMSRRATFYGVQKCQVEKAPSRCTFKAIPFMLAAAICFMSC